MSRQSIPDQLAAAKAQQLGELEIRTRSPEGHSSTRACWGRVTAAQLAEVVKFVEKITEGNR